MGASCGLADNIGDVGQVAKVREQYDRRALVGSAETEGAFNAVVVAEKLRCDPGRTALLDIVKKTAFVPQR